MGHTWRRVSILETQMRVEDTGKLRGKTGLYTVGVTRVYC